MPGRDGAEMIHAKKLNRSSFFLRTKRTFGNS
jgi:hypothetical protein